MRKKITLQATAQTLSKINFATWHQKTKLDAQKNRKGNPKEKALVV
jgi:hypothetical protein